MATFMGEIGGELFPTSKIWDSQHIFLVSPSSVPVRWEALEEANVLNSSPSIDTDQNF